MIVNIIGKGLGWETAPTLSTEYETWGLTQLLLRRPVNLVIDMNVYDNMRWGINEKEENDKVKKLCPLMNIQYYGLENYPLTEVIDYFQTDYFNSTIDYALALAIYKQANSIHLYGINLTQGTEYKHQKPGVEFWCGIAKGKGIKVTTQEPTAILKTHDGLLYGYDTKQRI